MTTEQELQKLFIDNGWTLTVGESCTGGALSARLTSVAGSSKYFMGGIVSYATSVKEHLLKVPHETLVSYGAVSKETAAAMAKGAINAIPADFSLAITGIAGPSGGSDYKPVGTVWIATMSADKEPICRHLKLEGNRATIIEAAVKAALQELFDYAKTDKTS